MSPSSPHLLVIEDDAFMAALLRFLLERQGLQVTVLVDGRAALDCLQSEARFDAVVLDLRLPQVSGMEVLMRMRTLAAWSPTPVLVLSALDGGQDVAAALAMGAGDYLTKPFDPQELLARLQRLLPETLARNGVGG